MICKMSAWVIYGQNAVVSLVGRVYDFKFPTQKNMIHIIEKMKDCKCRNFSLLLSAYHNTITATFSKIYAVSSVT